MHAVHSQAVAHQRAHWRGYGPYIVCDTDLLNLSFKTPLGYLINISFLDEAKRVVFVNRHLCTAMDADGKATYAPPHSVDFHLILIGLKKLNVKVRACDLLLQAGFKQLPCWCTAGA